MSAPASGTPRSSRSPTGIFLRAALGPIQYAAGLVTANKVRPGLAELASEPLDSALQRAIGDVAASVAMRRADIERVLPMSEFAAVRDRLTSSQPNAISAWDLHAGPTGFMDAMTALTVDGRKPEIGPCIERVAKKLAADEGLTEPLQRLANDVSRWEELISTSVEALESGSWLKDAVFRRRLRVGLTATLPALVILGCGGAGLLLMSARSRIDKTLGGDVCAAAIAASDATWASRAQRDKLTASQSACTERQMKEAQELAAKQARDAAEQKIAAEKKAHLDACTKTADDVASGALGGPRPDVVPDDEWPELGRIAQKKLDLADIGPTDPKFPCDDVSGTDAKFKAAFQQALFADPESWAAHADPSPFVAKLVTDNASSMPARVMLGLATAADLAAKDGLTSGKPDVIARAKRLCALIHEASTIGTKYCQAAAKL